MGERFQHENFFETLLHQQLAEKKLTIRNLCFPGDEPFHRERSENFGSPDFHLEHSKADVVVFFFGFNESFGGPMGLKKFKEEMTRLIRETRGKSYNGKSPCRVIVVSPIAFENTGDKNLPSGESQNRNLKSYTEGLKEVCAKSETFFVDLFQPTLELFEKSDQRLTLNGCHLNSDGHRALAPIFLQRLTGQEAPARIDPNLKKQVDDKNFHWWHRYRAVNGFSIYGKRGLAGKDGSNTYNNRDVMERERTILDQMTANRDQRIWTLASGGKIAEKVDDSNTLPFFEPTTNVGGPNDVNRKRGKLGSLDYLDADEQQKLFKLPDGYKISVVATEEEIPDLANPVAINFDNRGRLWVATMPSYPHWKPKTPMNDKVIILTDKNGDGRMDGSITFADGLHQPTGFEIGHGGAFVAQQPDILFLKDTDGDDIADQRTRKLVGFDTADSHHGISAFEWGPGGGLYFQEGTFKYSQVESPYGLTRMHEAGIWRYDPRTEKFEAHVSFAFANPWGHVFDRFGQNFIADASPGFNYWATPISGHVVHPDKHTGGSQYRRINPGRLKKQGDYPRFLVKRTRPSSGCEFLISSHFPPEFQNNFLVNNVIGERSILNHKVHEDGSGFGGSEVERLVFCEDGNFRPVDLQMGPDGALYICDWHNALIGHLQHNLRDPSRDHSHGRIWKVTYEGRQLVKPPKIEGIPESELLAMLPVYEDRTRYRVKRELAQRDSGKVIAAVKQWVKSLDSSAENYERMLLEALWQHQTHNEVEEVLLERAMKSSDHRVRAAATRVATFWRDQLKNPLGTLARSIHDKHPRVRLEAVRGCSFLPTADSLELVLDVLKYEMDHWLDYTLEETVRTLTNQLARQQMMAMHHQKPDSGSHEHSHHAANVSEPVVFLDKDRRIIRFQLDRLSDAELLAIRPQADNPNFAMVSLSILCRESTPDKSRSQALANYSRLSGKNEVDAIAAAFEYLPEGQGGAVARNKLARLLARLQPEVLRDQADLIRRKISSSGDAGLKSGLYGALVTIGQVESAEQLAEKSEADRQAFLMGIRFSNNGPIRNSLHGRVLGELSRKSNRQNGNTKRAAIETLASIEAEKEKSFDAIAKLAPRKAFKTVAIQALLKTPARFRPPETSRNLAVELIKQAEATPAKDRTSTPFTDAANLADQLLVAFPPEKSRELRRRLRSVAVRVVRIHTVEEEMRYDVPYFAVEAGRPVQVVLVNEDLMPHNLVITAPGKIREVAELAALLGPTEGVKGKQYVPQSKLVLQATGMVPARQSEALTFTAPRKAGEYPFVCTFPRHWMRMYGVMVVVDDLDAWQRNPVPPKDPIGSNRTFVKKWTTGELAEQVKSAPQAVASAVGAKLFKEATCAQCHKLGDEGGAVGPDLSEVFAKYKQDRVAVLKEILEPSSRIDPQYEVYLLQTFDGLSLSGIITQQDNEKITLIANPENPKPTTIMRDDIEAMKKTASSLMPKALLDNFTREEILELLSYIEANQKPPSSKTK
ncbi:MAG: PVC-type heme-binding CxxCH protein [Planctomycetota bacterium]|nr:PVC-type heme-binding CxxCH protein [Planctomycetota bacterium]